MGGVGAAGSAKPVAAACAARTAAACVADGGNLAAGGAGIRKLGFPVLFKVSEKVVREVISEALIPRLDGCKIGVTAPGTTYLLLEVST